MTEHKNPLEGILSPTEIAEMQGLTEGKEDNLAIQIISRLHAALESLLAVGPKISQQIALQLIHGELQEKENMTTNVITPETISELIRKGKRIILSPVDASPTFMTMEIRNAYGSEAERQEAWYYANKTNLAKQYEGQHLLICGCQLITADPDLAVVVERRDSKYPNRKDTLIIMNVTKEETPDEQ